MVETWVGEKRWERIRDKLPEGYVWGIQAARKRNRKRKAIGGMVMRIRKELLEEGIGIEREGGVNSGKSKEREKNGE